MIRLIFLLLASVPLVAQMGMAPPKELDRLAPLLGRWEGRGTFSPGPDGPEMPWTSVNHTRKVMGGHFVRDDSIVSLGEMGSLGFIAFHSWNPTSRRIVVHTLGNMGQLDVSEMRWVDDSTMVTVGTGWEMGQRTMERWTTKVVGDGKLEMVGEKAVDGGPLFIHVKGTAVRKDGPAPKLDGVGAFMATPGPELEKIHRMAGQYAVSGEYTLSPEADAMSWSGQEGIDPIFGGTVMRLESSGTGGYVGFGAIVWDPTKARYRSVHFNSMGMAHEAEGWMLDATHYASYMTMTMEGSPMALRNVITLDDAGRPKASHGYAMTGTGAPFESMTAKYAPKKSQD